jgi:hypothetical protein
MMDHVWVTSNKYLHLYGALFVFGVLDAYGNVPEHPVFQASQSLARVNYSEVFTTSVDVKRGDAVFRVLVARP